MQSGANVLILDEPTNHLDVDSREALEDALCQFTGSLLLISHDRALLDAVGTRTVAFEDGTLRTYLGGWAEYLRVREERAAEQAAAQAATTAVRSRASPKPAASRPPASTAMAVRRQARTQIEEAEAVLRSVEEELADPAAWSTPERSAESSARHEAAKRAVDELYARYEQVVG